MADLRYRRARKALIGDFFAYEWFVLVSMGIGVAIVGGWIEFAGALGVLLRWYFGFTMVLAVFGLVHARFRAIVVVTPKKIRWKHVRETGRRGRAHRRDIVDVKVEVIDRVPWLQVTAVDTEDSVRIAIEIEAGPEAVAHEIRTKLNL